MTGSSFTDNTIDENKAAHTYIYKVISMAGEEEGDGAYSDPVVSCSSKPSWEEVKPR